MSLLDRIKQRKSQKQQAPAGGQTEAAARLLAAKSGKASSVPTTPVSQEAERAVAAQTGQQLGDLAQQGRMESLGISGAQEAQAAKELEAGTRLAVGKEELSSQRSQALAEMSQELRLAGEKLGLSKEEADVQAQLFETRLNSQKYIRDLKQDGMLDRAFSAKESRSELLKMQLGEDMTNFLTKLGFEKELFKEDVDWEKIMKEVKMEREIADKRSAWQQQRTSAIFGGMGSAGGVAASKWSASDSDTTDRTKKD